MIQELVFGLSLLAMLNTAGDIQILRDGDIYKTERILDLQKHALSKGIESWKLRPMVAWFYTETGTLSEYRRGDYGMSVGICQCHTYWRQCTFTYEEQREQCISWYIGYTDTSSPESIYRDIRRGHNSRSTTYENKIRKKESLFIGGLFVF